MFAAWLIQDGGVTVRSKRGGRKPDALFSRVAECCRCLLGWAKGLDSGVRTQQASHHYCGATSLPSPPQLFKLCSVLRGVRVVDVLRGVSLVAFFRERCY